MLSTLSGTAIDTTATQLEQDARSMFRQSYHEIADRHVVETDVIEQLRANMAQLEDMHGRLKFLMGEVAYLLKKN
jgi:hypothetical protein